MDELMFSHAKIDRPVRWLALAGFMGTGKSRVGWELSRRLLLNFVDTDKVIERVSGMKISEIFEYYGEETFRAYEREVLKRTTHLDLAVVSLGGGAFVNPENRAVLKARGPVVVLHATPETIFQRTRKSDRPLLKVEDPVARIKTLLQERGPAYAEGDIHIHTDHHPSEQVVLEIIEKLWEYRHAQDSRSGQ
ncbi:shikimate kinase [Deinococcus misasensis]|uniref:shikimate kinase n=1 Tax=Deinococcus misasensis TaxID=392413 RepID=UPI0012F835BB|nr:shikimate kinase [Deinococcus misasensis]